MSLVCIAPLFSQATDNSICSLIHVLHSLLLPWANNLSEILYILMVILLLSLMFSSLLNYVQNDALSMKFMRSGLRDYLFKPSVCSICFPSKAPFHCVYTCIVRSRVSIIIQGGNKHSQNLVSGAYCNSSKHRIQFCCLTMFDLYHFNLLKTKRNLLYIRNQSVPRGKLFPPRL